MDREIGRYCCLKEMRYNLPDIYKVRSALVRLIITEKTFGEPNILSGIKNIDPVVPEFIMSHQ